MGPPTALLPQPERPVQAARCRAPPGAGALRTGRARAQQGVAAGRWRCGASEGALLTECLLKFYPHPLLCLALLQSPQHVSRSGRPADDRPLRSDHVQGCLLKDREIAGSSILDQQALITRSFASRMVVCTQTSVVTPAIMRCVTFMAVSSSCKFVGRRRPSPVFQHCLARLCARAGTMSLPGSPAMGMRPIGPGSPIRSLGLPRWRLAAGSPRDQGDGLSYG